VAAQRLAANAWMTPATRQLAIDKVHAAEVFLGHSDRAPAAETLALSSSSHLDNVMVGNRRAFDRLVRADGAEAAAATWQVAPFTATAAYRPQFNDFLLPIGIVQPPVFDPRFDAALNYGALGAIVGHELFHAFDANGRRFDAHGRPQEWWDSQTSEAFRERLQCLSDHLAHYEAFPATPASAAIVVDSARVADETIADIAGVTIAFDAYRAHVAASAAPPPLIDGLTDEQLFFLAYAQLWCAELHPAYALFLAGVDPHAPVHVRVNAVLSQVPEFGEAFGCDRHTPMRPANPCGFWSAAPPPR
jgi:predicted metalloendopeptidase